MIPKKCITVGLSGGEKPKLAKKKLLFLITNLSHGGAERVLVNLANNMDKEKYDITLMTIFDTGVNKKYLSSHIHYCSVFPKMFHGIKFITGLCPARVLHKLFIREKYDVEIAYLEGPPAKIISGCSDKKTKKISWIHIEILDDKVFKVGFLNKKQAVESYKSFDKIVCVSETVKECFSNISGITENVIVKYNTNETELIREKASQSVDDFSFSEDILTLCSVAKIEEAKGYDRLLEVHKSLLDEGLKHRIIILGIGSQKAVLEKRAKELGVEKTFLLLGFRDNPYKYVSKSDLYICSSRREGFSTAVTEALIAGVPVVSTKCSGAEELLGKNNEYGIVVENSTEGIYSGIKAMLSDLDLLKTYKEKASLRGDYFSREKTVSAVEKMLVNFYD